MLNDNCIAQIEIYFLSKYITLIYNNYVTYIARYSHF